MVTHEMIIALPKSDVDEIDDIEECFLFQHYVYKTSTALTYEELVSYEMNNGFELNKSISEAEIREKFNSLASFLQENVRIVSHLLNQIDIFTDLQQRVNYCVKLFEYINNHNLHPLFSNNYTKLYQTLLYKILALLKSTHGQTGQSERLINSLFECTNKLFCVSDDDIQTLIKKYYELSPVDNFFKNWRLFFVYRYPTVSNEKLVRLQEINEYQYLQHFPDMKFFLNDLLVRSQTEQEQT